ncbi:hypothetical protein Pcinc_043949, partial [Petrolisthes cinctipes]
FCVGDRFYLCDNKILCEYDYEERMVFANMSYSSDSLAHIKRQQPPEDAGLAQRGGAPTHAAPQQQHQMGMNGMSVGGGPGTSGMLLPALGERGSLGQTSQQHGGSVGEDGVGMLKTPASSSAPQPNSSNQAVADDASSGYGSPDSLTMEDR